MRILLPKKFWVLLLLATKDASAFGGNRVSFRKLRQPLLNLSKKEFLVSGDQDDNDDAARAELEAIGGDPFFLPDSNVEKDATIADRGKDDKLMEERTAEILEMGGDPFFLSEDEDEDEISYEDGDEDESIQSQSESFLQMAMSAGGGAGMMDLISGIESPSQENAKSGTDKNKSTVDRASDIEAMGVDPSFLTEEELQETTVTEDDMNIISDSFMQMAMMAGGGAMGLLDGMKYNSDEETFSNENDSAKPAEETASEIEAMGGDPFFLPDTFDDTTNLEDAEESSDATEAFMEMAMSAGGGVLGMLGGIDSKEDQIQNTVDAFKSFEERTSEIEAMGGDPFFLPDDDEISSEQTNEEISSEQTSNETALDLPSSPLMEVAISADGPGVGELDEGVNGKISKIDSDDDEPLASSQLDKIHSESDDWEWDGTVDEEAHMGF